MPRGSAEAKKMGDFSSRGGGGMQQKPRGLTYFKLVNDRDEAVVRFLQQHEDIEWLAQWKTAPKPGFPYGEKVTKVDQHEAGVPDPGYALSLKSAWTAYVPMIWRNAPVYQKDQQGQFIKDGNQNKVLVGYQDQIAIWECSYNIYDLLRDAEADYRGLMSRDFKITRLGAARSNKTTYKIIPFPDASAPPSPMTQQDVQLAQTQWIDMTQMLKIPTYEELATYLNGGAPLDPSMMPQGQPQGGVPIQHQPGFPSMPAPQGQPMAAPGMPVAPAPPAWPAAPQQAAPMAPPAPPVPQPAPAGPPMQPPGLPPAPPMAPQPQPGGFAPPPPQAPAFQPPALQPDYNSPQPPQQPMYPAMGQPQAAPAFQPPPAPPAPAPQPGQPVFNQQTGQWEQPPMAPPAAPQANPFNPNDQNSAGGGNPFLR